jgi:hypothetical protein
MSIQSHAMENTPGHLNRGDVPRAALLHRSSELHYTAHFRDPLDIDIGDIGYITGDPPQFVWLDNVSSKMSPMGAFRDHGVQKSRFAHRDRWTTEVVQGIVRFVSPFFRWGIARGSPTWHRHAFRFRDSDASELADWRTQRPRLDKYFKLRRFDLPHGSPPGLVVDCAQAWKCLAERAFSLADNHTECSISPSNLILGQ